MVEMVCWLNGWIVLLFISEKGKKGQKSFMLAFLAVFHYLFDPPRKRSVLAGFCDDK